jgi:large subunit ribosomal protein L25
MQEISLNLESRTITGKAVRQLRNQGLVPAVIHDHGKESIVVMAPYVDIAKAYQQAGKHHPVNLTNGSKKYLALIKTVDYDPKKNQLRHIVFGAVKANETVTAEVPIHIVYDEGNDSSPAERAGLVVLTQLDTVEVEALPKYLPDAVEVSGESLIAVGDQLTVADLKVIKDVAITSEPEQVIATAFEPGALQAANDDAGGDEVVTETENPTGETVTDAVEVSDAKPATDDKK